MLLNHPILLLLDNTAGLFPESGQPVAGLRIV